jgi:hypothetical protein
MQGKVFEQRHTYPRHYFSSHVMLFFFSTVRKIYKTIHVKKTKKNIGLNRLKFGFFRCFVLHE